MWWAAALSAPVPWQPAALNCVNRNSLLICIYTLRSRTRTGRYSSNLLVTFLCCLELELILNSIMKSFPLELRQNWLKKLPRLTPSDWAIKNIELSILTLIWVDHWRIFNLEYLPVHVDTRPLHFCSATATVLCPSLPTREAWWNWKLPLSKYDVDNRIFIKQKILRLIHNWLEH